MRPEKQSILDEIRGYTNESSYAYVVDYDGMDAQSTQALKAGLREAGATFHVVKNRMFRIIAGENGWEGVDADLKGPSAIVTGGDDVSVAKILKKFNAADGKPGLKGGISAAAYLSAEDIKTLADLPPREVLLAHVVGTIAAPMSQLVGVMNQKLLSLMYVLKAAAENKS